MSKISVGGYNVKGGTYMNQCPKCNKKTIASYWSKILKMWVCFECNEKALECPILEKKTQNK